jgi:hypothetical protein
MSGNVCAVQNPMILPRTVYHLAEAANWPSIQKLVAFGQQVIEWDQGDAVPDIMKFVVAIL